MKLNKEKCIFERERVKFLSHVFSSKGLELDSEKTDIIHTLKPAQNKTQIQRF